MPKAFSRLHHIKRPNSPRGPEPMDADLQGGTVYFTVAQLEGIRRGCTAKAAHKTGASKRPHSNFCPRNRLLAAGQQFTPATTAKGPGARAKADAGAVPTVVVVVEQGDARLSPRPSEGGVFVCTDGSTTATQGQPEAGPAEAVARHVVFRPAAPPGPLNSLTLLRAPTAEDQPRGRGVQYSPLKASASARLSARPNEDTAMAPFDPAKVRFPNAPAPTAKDQRRGRGVQWGAAIQPAQQGIGVGALVGAVQGDGPVRRGQGTFPHCSCADLQRPAATAQGIGVVGAVGAAEGRHGDAPVRRA
jgi:hypothetical protein